MISPLRSFPVSLATLVLSFLVNAPGARAAAIHSLTFTPSGANASFAITGRFPPFSPATTYSSPDAPYSLTFALPTAPSSLAFIDAADGIFGINTTITLHGVNSANTQIAFFVSSEAGGLDVCLSDSCSPDPPTFLARWVLFGDQLFTGSVSSPVFISGSAKMESTEGLIKLRSPRQCCSCWRGSELQQWRLHGVADYEPPHLMEFKPVGARRCIENFTCSAK